MGKHEEVWDSFELNLDVQWGEQYPRPYNPDFTNGHRIWPLRLRI